MSQSIKKTYRDKILASTTKKGREFTLDDMKLFFKFPTRRDKREIIEKATLGKEGLNHALLETWAVIKLTQIAETGEQLFSEEDFDVIEELQTGGTFDEVALEALQAILGVESDPKELPKD